MITLKTTAIEPKTLYKACLLTGSGVDICDTDWDMESYFECEDGWDKANDGYTRFMLLMGCNVKVSSYKKDWYTNCNLADFMWDNRDVFEPFFNEHNREGYRPMDYDEIDPGYDTGFYEAYMQPMESLLAGNYSDKDYQKLYEMLAAKAEE